MVVDAVRGYVQLASGLGDVTRQRATQVAKQLLEQSGGLVSGVAASAGSADVAKQAQGLAEDLLATGRTNRDLLIGLIRTEVERAINRFGLVGADELSAMARVVERLQNQLDAAIAFGGRPGGSSSGRAADESAAGTREGPARRPVKRAPMTFAAGAPSAQPTGTRKATAKKTAAKKAAAKKSVAKKAAVKKVPAKKNASSSQVTAPAAHRPDGDPSPTQGSSS